MTPKRAAVRRLIGACACAAAVVVFVRTAETQQPPSAAPPGSTRSGTLDRSARPEHAPRRGERAFGRRTRRRQCAGGAVPEHRSAGRGRCRAQAVRRPRCPSAGAPGENQRRAGRSDPATPDREVAGTIRGPRAARTSCSSVQRKSEPGPIWLISQTTITAALRQHDEIASSRWNGFVPAFLISTRMGGLRLVDILAILIGFPLLYLATVLLNRALTPLIGLGFRAAGSQRQSVLPASARLLLVVIAGRWLLSSLPLSLAVRQMFSTLAIVIIIATIARLLMLLTGEVERYVLGRIALTNRGSAALLLRLLRRGGDLLIVFAAVIAVLFLGMIPRRRSPVLAWAGSRSRWRRRRRWRTSSRARPSSSTRRCGLATS